MLLKKIVVHFPYPDQKGTFGTTTFEVKDKKAEYLLVDNTEQGCLIIRCAAELPKYNTHTLAVFKDWIYWVKSE